MGTCAESVVFKCRKCRHFLFTDVNVISSHSKPYQSELVTDGLSCDNKSIESVWFLQEENVTDWLKEQLNNGEWIKGKIFCPKCWGRIGSFDFISGSQCPCKQMVLPSLHVVKSKVDCEPMKKISLGMQSSVDCSVPSITAAGSDHFDMSENYWQEDNSQHYYRNGFSKSKFPINDEFIGTETKLRKQKQHGGKYDLSNLDSNFSGHQTSGGEVFNPIPLETSNSLVCAICLDVYLSPFTCQPCGHVFCETCLRKIAKPKPTHTYCPICRQLIGQCELNREISQAVKSEYPEELQARLLEEDKDCRHFPLPWNSEYHPGLYSFGLEYDRDADQRRSSNWWTFFSAQQQTFALLLSLKIISAVMFFLGFFGGWYATAFLRYFSAFAPPVFQEIIDALLKNNDSTVE